MRLRSLDYIPFTLCTYESFALLTGRVPSITRYTSEHRWMQPVLVAALAAHLLNFDHSGDR